jgi:hypothetical protein
LPAARDHRDLQTLSGEPRIAGVGLDAAGRESQLTEHIHDFTTTGPQIENRLTPGQLFPKLAASFYGDPRGP